MSPKQDPSTSTEQGRPARKNAARTARIRMPDGEEFTIGLGWTELSDGSRAFLRRDGVVTFESAPTERRAQAPADSSSEVTEATTSVAAPYPNWSRPPFTKGHELSVKHGATSPRKVEPLAAELVTTTLAAAPFLAEPSFAPAVQAWARAEARCALLATWLDTHGLLDESGAPRPATALMTQMESLALKLRTRLGLDAASRAGIEASLTSTAASQVSLEAALERGAALIRERVRLQTESSSDASVEVAP